MKKVLFGIYILILTSLILFVLFNIKLKPLSAQTKPSALTFSSPFNVKFFIPKSILFYFQNLGQGISFLSSTTTSYFRTSINLLSPVTGSYSYITNDKDITETADEPSRNYLSIGLVDRGKFASRLTIYPPGYLYSGIFKDLLLTNGGEMGFYYSTNGGQTWKLLTYLGNYGFGVTTLGFPFYDAYDNLMNEVAFEIHPFGAVTIVTKEDLYGNTWKIIGQFPRSKYRPSILIYPCYVRDYDNGHTCLGKTYNTGYLYSNQSGWRSCDSEEFKRWSEDLTLKLKLNCQIERSGNLCRVKNCTIPSSCPPTYHYAYSYCTGACSQYDTAYTICESDY